MLVALKPHCPAGREGKGGAGRGGAAPQPSCPDLLGQGGSCHLRWTQPPPLCSAEDGGVWGGEGDSAFLQMPGPAFQLQDVDWGCGEAQTGRRAR